ncbi:MAG: hemerythrin [Francisellaceae bacterium]|nr:hemerythrin [Francisellaceae bacterium]
MDAIEILEKEHVEILSLLKKLEQTNKDSIDERETLIKRIYELVSNHSHNEEKLIYPESIKNNDLEALTREAIQEHHVIDLLLNEIIKMPVTHKDWIAKCTVLRENLEHHIKEEEETLFPKLQKLMSNVQLSEIGEIMMEQKPS